MAANNICELSIALFSSIVVVITLDYLVGTSLLNLYSNEQQEEKTKKAVEDAARNWGLLAALLYIFLILTALNLLILFFYPNRILLNILFSLIFKALILIGGALPYFCPSIKRRYPDFSWPWDKKKLKKFGWKYWIAFAYPISFLSIMWVTIYAIPTYSDCLNNNIYLIKDIIWPSLVIILFQIVNLIISGAWNAILDKTDQKTN